MLIQKGGITRNVDDKRLQEYKDKGYAAVEEKTTTEAGTGEKQEPEKPKK